MAAGSRRNDPPDGWDQHPLPPKFFSPFALQDCPAHVVRWYGPCLSEAQASRRRRWERVIVRMACDHRYESGRGMRNVQETVVRRQVMRVRRPRHHDLNGCPGCPRRPGVRWPDVGSDPGRGHGKQNPNDGQCQRQLCARAGAAASGPGTKACTHRRASGKTLVTRGPAFLPPLPRRRRTGSSPDGLLWGRRSDRLPDVEKRSPIADRFGMAGPPLRRRSGAGSAH